jgi:hypothetical protein
MNGLRLSLALIGLLLACADEASPAPEQAAVAAEPPAQAPAEPPAPTNPETPAELEQRRAMAAAAMLDTVDALGELHRRHADDCTALARAISDFHAQHAAALAEVPSDVLAHIDADEALRVRMRAAMESVMSASMNCRDDPAFAAAGAALFGAQP